MTYIDTIAAILGFLESPEDNTSFEKQLKEISKPVKALDLVNQYIKALQYMEENNLNESYLKYFPDQNKDLKEFLSEFAADKSGRKRVSIIASLKTNYKSFKYNEDGSREEIDNPIQQEKHYSLNNGDKFTNFYSVEYIEKVSTETGHNFKCFEDGNSMINLAIIYFVPIPKSTLVREVKPEYIKPEEIKSEEIKKKKKSKNNN